MDIVMSPMVIVIVVPNMHEDGDLFLMTKIVTACSSNVNRVHSLQRFDFDVIRIHEVRTFIIDFESWIDNVFRRVQNLNADSVGCWRYVKSGVAFFVSCDLKKFAVSVETNSNSGIRYGLFVMIAIEQFQSQKDLIT